MEVTEAYKASTERLLLIEVCLSDCGRRWTDSVRREYTVTALNVSTYEVDPFLLAVLG